MNMVKLTNWLAAIALLLAMTACTSSMDREAHTDFKLLPNGGFEFRATANWVYVADSATAEVTRIAWLEQYLSLNKICPIGYEVTDRTVVLLGRSLIGPNHDVYYTGSCTE